MQPLLWTLALCLSAAFAQNERSNTVCPSCLENWKNTMEKKQEQCVSAVGVEVRKEFLKLSNDLKARDDALVQLVQKNKEELKKITEDKANQIISDLKTTNENVAELRKLAVEQKEKYQALEKNQDELLKVFKESAGYFAQALGYLQSTNQQLQRLANESGARESELQKLRNVYHNIKSAASENTTQCLKCFQVIGNVQETSEKKFQKLETESKARDDTIMKLRQFVEDISGQVQPNLSGVVTNQALSASISKLGSEMRQFVRQASEQVYLNLSSQNELQSKKKQEEHLIKCQAWKLQVGGLQLTKIRSGLYYYNNTNVRWYNAQKFCKSHGMGLATIETEEEMRRIKAAGTGGCYWVGASDIGHTPGDFAWTDGRDVDRAWRNDRSQYGKGKQTCLDLCDRNLDDDPCTVEYRFVCKVTAEFADCA